MRSVRETVPKILDTNEPPGSRAIPDSNGLGRTTKIRRGMWARKTRGARRPALVIALFWLAAVIVFVACADLIAPYGANEQDLSQTLAAPSMNHLLGTDNLGRDIFSRLLFGGRISLLSVLLATAVALALGGAFGLVAGYVSGAVDAVVSAAADILMSIPVVVILLSIAAVTSRNTVVLMLAVGVLMSASVFRVFRAATLEVRQELYVTAARTSGLGDVAILRRHVLPRLGALVFVQMAVISSIALIVQVGLGFLSIDVRPPAPSWGNMVAAASQTMYTSVWPLVSPGLVIALTVLAFSLVGDAAQQSRTGRTRQIGLGGGATRVAPRPEATAADHDSVSGADTVYVTDQSSLLTLRNVTVSVPTGNGHMVDLIDHVSIDLNAGEIVGLVGESGAGKSITARSILGIAAKGSEVSGSITYRGTELLGASEADLASVRGKEIAFIGQDPMVSLSPLMRVGTQLSEAVRTHRGISKTEAKTVAHELLTLVRIPDPEKVARLYPHQISGGMAQRIVIAMALAGDPSILIADEPTTALDVSVQMQILDLLRSLQTERGLAVLLVTHDWGVVADICDRAVVMYAGQVVEEAPVDEIFYRSQHPYSFALRAADPHSQRAGNRLVTIAGQVPPPDDRPIGCRFASRCEFAVEVCRSAPIALSTHGATHQVRCVRTDAIGFGHE